MLSVQPDDASIAANTIPIRPNAFTRDSFGFFFLRDRTFA
jgi:hypothetical protein